jgi:hypothetical protein
MSPELHWLRRGHAVIFCVVNLGESIEWKRILKRQTIRKDKKEVNIEVGQKDVEGWQDAQSYYNRTVLLTDAFPLPFTAEA